MKYDLSGSKILLVEDNKVNQIVATQLLNRWHAEVIVVNNGKEAVSFLEKEMVDLVLMDLQMPVMNGYDAALLIRQKHSSVLNHNVPIIALTADVFPEVKQKVMEYGMNDFITKPFEQAKLYAAIDHLITIPKQVLNTNIDENQNPGMNANLNFIDLTELLILVDNDEDALSAVLGEFVETTPNDVTSLETAVNEKNNEKVTAWAHKLKSSFRHLGMEQAADACKELELIGKGKQSADNMQNLMDVVSEQFAGALEEVKNKLSEFN